MGVLFGDPPYRVGGGGSGGRAYGRGDNIFVLNSSIGNTTI